MDTCPGPASPQTAHDPDESTCPECAGWYRCNLCGCEGGEDFLETPCHRNPVPHSPWMQGPHECDPIERT